VRIQAHGLELELPAGWDGRIGRRPNALPVAHAASFALPAEDGDFAALATSSMPPDGVVVVLAEYDSAFAGTGLFAPAGPPRSLRPQDFSPATLLHRIPGQVGLQRFFSNRGRAFCLYVVLGSGHRAPALARTATSLLRTLAVSPAGSSPAAHRPAS
jgi:hypothetical protein